jgi:hypothetical protein
MVVTVSAMGDSWVVSCDFPFGSDSGTVPSEALMLLPAGPGQIRVSADDGANVGNADWGIGLSTRAYAATTSGSDANLAITLE